MVKNHPGEIRLLWITGFLFLGVITIYGLGWLEQKQSLLDQEYRRQRASQIEGQSLLDDRAAWDERVKWVRQSAPVMGEEGKTKAEVLESSLQSARSHHLQIIEQSLGEVQRDPVGISVSAKIKVEGTMEDLCRWLSSWQTPESFNAVTSFSLRAGEDEKSIICTLTLKRFFQEGK